MEQILFYLKTCNGFIKKLGLFTLFLLFGLGVQAQNYCIPVFDEYSGYYSLYMQSFTTTGGITNINNTNSGYSANGYGNFSSTHSVSGLTGQNISFSAVPKNYNEPMRLKIWVDWNNDGIFNNNISETVYTFSNYDNNSFYGTLNTSFTIPADKAVGSYRMRVIMDIEIGYPYPGPCEISSNSPNYYFYYGETEDYTLTVLAPPCAAPTAITATNVTLESATLNWTSTGNNFDIEWGTAGFVQGQGTTATTTTTNYALSNLEIGTSYDFYVRQNCSDNESDWVKHTFSTNNYCIPSFEPDTIYYNTYMQSFTTMGGVTNINNTDSGFSTGGYGNFSTTHSVSGLAGQNISFSAVPKSFTEPMRLKIWVDWNNDGLFNNNGSETVYTFSNYDYYPFNGTLNASFTIPADKAVGSYQMRVIMDSGNLFGYESPYPNPCEISYTHPNYVEYFGEAEDYTLTVLEVPPCDVPTAVTATDITLESATLNWTSTGNNFDIEWGIAGFTQGQGTIATTTTTNYALSNLEIGTSYDFYVRQHCSDNESNWVKYTFTTNDYCIPASNQFSLNYGDYIQSFTTTGGVTNIDNTDSGFSTGGYGNFSATHSVSQYQGESISFSAVQGDISQRTLKIWIDWNNDGIFNDDNSEIVYFSSSSSQTIEDSFQIAVEKNAGSYRMRVMIMYQLSDTPFPCTTNIFGEIEDYTLTVLEVPPCDVPTAVTATDITLESATINWTSTGTNFDIEWGTAGFTQGQGTQDTTTTTSYALSNLTLGTSYDFYVRQHCSDNESDWVKYTFSTNDYCIPTSSPESPNYGDYIQSFTTTGGVTNITNTNSGFSTDGYGNFSATHSVSQYQGESISFSAIQGNNYYNRHLKIWVDWNKDGVFNDDNSEIVHFSYSSSQTIEDSFQIPVEKNAGSYRMRIMIIFLADYTPCSTNIYGEAEDYTLTVLEVPPCEAPTDVIAYTTETGATLHWTSTGYDFDIEWGTAGFVQGQGTQDTAYATNYFLSNLTFATSYDFYVRQSCSDNESDWVKHTFTTNDYCIPISHPNSGIVGNYIDSFTTTGGVTNINNTDSGYSANGYSNYTAIHSVSQYQGENISFSAVLGASEYERGLIIFIDWNNDGVFNYYDSEKVYNSLAFNGSFEIPADQALGSYRMRVFTLFAEESINTICQNWYFGETEDYTLTVLENTSVSCNSDTIWNGIQWSNGEPDSNTRAIIEGDLTLTADMTACELLLNSGILTVNSGVTLTVNREIVNTQNADNFIVQSGGNLIQVDDVENTGAIKVKRNTTIKHLDYTIWSSPVIGQKLKAFSPLTLNSRIRSYNGSDNTWQIVQNPETTDFETGKGYMFRAPNANDGSYAGTYNWTGTFTGTPENGDVTAEFSTLGEYQSIGNPYPSNIDVASFYAANPNTGALYFWTNTNPYVNGTYDANNWAIYSGMVGLPAANDTTAPNGIISVGQGFIIETDGTIDEVVFNNTMRTSDSGVFFRTMTEEKHRLWLTLSNENTNINQAVIGYMDGATNGFDFGIDAKLFGYSGSALYSLIDNNQADYIIQGRSFPFNDYDVVPLGFKAVNNGSYTISLSNFDGLFAEGQDIFLKDTFTQTTQNLKDGSYTFVSETGTFNDRFEVVYRDSSLSVNNPDLNNSWIVYKQDNTFHIQTQGFEMKEIVVYDVLGRVVYDAKNINTSTHTFPTVNGNQMLIVKIISTENQVLSKKTKN